MSASAATPGRIPDAGPSHTLEIAHVLFTDIVGYSKHPMDEQEQLLTQLQDAVRHALDFVDTAASEDAIRVPTGDGMALVFFRDAEAPVRCALELGQLLRNSKIKLRMGIHSGPVYRVADINANRAVAGGGINIAQRVMDTGDAGHILLSNAEAEVLGQISTWSHTLHDLGEVEVKHGVRLKIYNLYSDEAGNPKVPEKIARERLKQNFNKRYLSIGVIAAVLLVALVSSWLLFTHKAHALSATDTIVLADFSNMTSDKVFDQALILPLKVSLSQSVFLNILPEEKVGQTLRQMTRLPSERLTQDLAREVCQRAGSKAYIAGSIAEVGSQYVIGLEAMNCASGDVLAREQVTAAGKDQVVSQLGQAASQLRNKLGESLSSVQSLDVPLAQATTNSLEALEAYSLGRKTSGETQIGHIKRAIELDSNFAMAYYLLGNIYYNNNQPALAAEYMKTAFNLRNLVTKPEKLIIGASYYVVVTGDLQKANEAYELGIKFSREYNPYIDLGNNYMILGQYEKAAAVTQEALRLDPLSLAAYENLPQIYLALNRFDEARATIDQALDRKIEQNLNSYALAFFRGDVTAMKRHADATIGDSSSEDQMFSEESDTEAWYGRLAKARELSQKAQESARRGDGQESAALWQVNSAIREALFGNTAAALHNVTASLTIAPRSKSAELEGALAYALAGDVAHAQPLEDDLAKRFPADTVVQSVWLPTIRAQVENDRKNASRSVELLQVAAPYELGMLSGSASKSCLYPIYVRAEAYLKMQQGVGAAAEFQKILRHRGLLWNCATGALAHLGLGRAYVLQGDFAKARTAYQDFLALWKDADPDIPILIAAKSEYAKLDRPVPDQTSPTASKSSKTFSGKRQATTMRQELRSNNLHEQVPMH